MMWKKWIREIRQEWLRHLVVFLMIFICLFIFSGLQHAQKEMVETGDYFLHKSRLTTGMVTTSQVTEKEQIELRKIPEVQKVIPRFWLQGLIQQGNLDNEVTIVSFSHQPNNRPMIVNGEKLDPEAMGKIWVNGDYAQENHLKIRDQLSVRIGKQTEKYTIAGFIKQPEFLYYVTSPDDPLPDLKHHGYAYVSEKEIQTNFPELKPNQMLIDWKNSDNTDEEWMQKRIQEVFGTQSYTWKKLSELPAIKNYFDKAKQIQKLSLVFPVLFLILVFITLYGSMKRLVDEQIEQIATLKSLGVSNAQIRLFYGSVAFVISFVAVNSGIIAGKYSLTPFVLRLLGSQYSIVEWQPVISWMSWMAGAVMVLLCTIVPLLTVNQRLKYAPAQLMRMDHDFSDKTSSKSSETVRWLSDSWQWTWRDVQRSKGRSVMGIFGAFGCLVLLIAGLGINDTVRTSFKHTFHQTYQYQEKVTFYSKNQEENLESLQEKGDDTEWEQQVQGELIQSNQKADLRLFMLQESPGGLIHLNDMKKQRIRLNELKRNEVVMSKQLAKRMNLETGDSIVVRIPELHQIVYLQINTLAINSAPQGIFMSKQIWENLDQTFQPQTVYLKEKLSQQQIKKLEEAPNVSKVVEKATLEKNTSEILATINGIIIILIFAAVLLGLTILANTFLLIFAERYREFATLKILGYSYRELFLLLLQENLLLVFVGILFGVPGGLLFLDYYARIVSLENQAYEPHLSLATWFIIFGIFLSIVGMLQLFLYWKIKKIDMLTALKSHE